MKITRLLVALIALLTITVQAQIPWTTSFIPGDVRAINIGTNAVGLTNGTTWSGITFTNTSGVMLWQTNAAAVNSSLAYRGLLQDIELWGDRDGNPISNLVVSTTFTGLDTGTAAVTFRFTPVPDGVNPSTAAFDKFVCAFAASGTARLTYITNFPAAWGSVRKVRAEAIYNADTDSGVILHALSVSGFKP